MTTANSAAATAGSTDESATGMLLSARGITKRFGGLVAVRSIDFDIPKGSIVSLIGPNGAGKTTFFNVIAGLYEPTDGTIQFQATRIVARPRRTWLEPFLWFALPAVVALIGLGLAFLGAATAIDVIIVFVTLGLLIAS